AYSFRFLAIALIGHFNFDTRLAFIWQRDPFAVYLHQNTDKFDSFLAMVVFLLECFNMFCQWKLYNLDVRKRIWRILHQMLVQSQDWYDQCQYSETKMHRIYHRKERYLAQTYQNRFNRYVKALI